MHCKGGCTIGEVAKWGRERRRGGCAAREGARWVTERGGRGESVRFVRLGVLEELIVVGIV